MKIMVPLKGYNQLETIIKVKPDEVYLGFYDNEWNERFGQYEEINRMSSFGCSANFVSKRNALIAVRQLKKEGIVGYLTLNSAMYSVEQFEYIRGIIDEFAESGCGIIAGDINIAKYCGMKNINCKISTMAGVYNAVSVKYLQLLGIKKVILPRDISLLNIENIIHECPDVQFEVFLMRNGCRYSDSNCMLFHARQYGSLCYNLDCAEVNVQIEKGTSRMSFFTNHSLYKNVFHKKACGLCALYKLYNAGVESLKIVGRADSSTEMLEDIKIVKRHIEIAKKCSSNEEYLSNMEIPKKWMEKCLYGLNCYYPESRY